MNLNRVLLVTFLLLSMYCLGSMPNEPLTREVFIKSVENASSAFVIFTHKKQQTSSAEIKYVVVKKSDVSAGIELLKKINIFLNEQKCNTVSLSAMENSHESQIAVACGFTEESRIPGPPGSLITGTLILYRLLMPSGEKEVTPSYKETIDS